MTERQVKDKVNKILANYPCYKLCPMTFGYGASGHPDILVLLNGRLIGIECKRSDKTYHLDKTRTPTSSERYQAIQLEKIKQCGGYVHIATPSTLDSLRQLLDTIQAM